MGNNDPSAAVLALSFAFALPPYGQVSGSDADQISNSEISDMDMTDKVNSVALVHDWLNQMGGAEFVLDVLHEMYPSAPIHTSLYRPDRMPSAMRAWDIHPSWLNRLPGAGRHPQYLLPFYPHAFSRLDLSAYDTVISVKSAFCLGVTTKGQHHQARHICYCLTPTRFLWQFDAYMRRERVSAPLRLLSRQLTRRLRAWEWAAAQKVDEFIAISQTVRQRIQDCYGRESVVIHPPVPTADFQGAADRTASEGHYLMVSRLVPYKRIDLAVDAFNRMPDRRLIIVGDGRDAEALQAQARANVTFTGFLPRTQVIALVKSCRAFVFPGEEDFGIAPVEAMSAGKPVIAYGAGGALDYVKSGATGILFDRQSPEALIQAVHACEETAWDMDVCQAQAERFSVEAFRRKFTAFLAGTD